jgi:hypothetical protein
MQINRGIKPRLDRYDEATRRQEVVRQSSGPPVAAMHHFAAWWERSPRTLHRQGAGHR